MRKIPNYHLSISPRKQESIVFNQLLCPQPAVNPKNKNRLNKMNDQILQRNETLKISNHGSKEPSPSLSFSSLLLPTTINRHGNEKITIHDG